MNVDISEEFQFLNMHLKSLSYGEFSFHDMGDSGGPFLNKLATPLCKGWEEMNCKKPYLHVLNAMKYSHAWALSMSGIGRVYPGFG